MLIDGAHALGMLPLDLQQLQPDFYVSNCHKWLCGARGSAMLFVAPRWQQLVQPPVLSHGAEAGFLSRFIWDGCRDYAPLLAISSAVKWWRGLGGGAVSPAAAAAAGSDPGDSILAAGTAAEAGAGAAAADECCCDPSILAHVGDGGAAARCYMYRLLRQAADFLTGTWGTACLGPPSMTAAMTLVRLPEGWVLPAAGSATPADAKYIQVGCGTWILSSYWGFKKSESGHTHSLDAMQILPWASCLLRPSLVCMWACLACSCLLVVV